MSSITFKYKKGLASLMSENYSALKTRLTVFTARLFNKNADEIIIDFEECQIYEGKRDVLIRGETSRKNLDLMKDWAEGIKKVMMDSNLGGQKLTIGIKTYVVDSFWEEFDIE